jgi:hypothetical protein
VWYGAAVDDPARGDATPIDTTAVGARARDGLLRLLALALLARGALSVVGATTPATGGLGPVHIGGLVEAVQSPLWGVAWGLVAIVAGVMLARRRRLGWLLAAAVCVAYLVVGVTAAFAAAPFADARQLGFWLGFVLDVAVPALVLAGLFTVRPWFLARVRG